MPGSPSGSSADLPGRGFRGSPYGGLAPALLVAGAAWTALHPSTRGHLRERTGGVLPPVAPGALWFHAASLGEGRVAEPVLVALGRSHPRLPLLRTATSEAGRKQVLPVDARACLPLDAGPLPGRLVRRLRARALVLVEGELWPGLLAACQGVLPIYALAFRVGEGTRRWARWAPRRFSRLCSRVHRWSARDEDSARWLEQHVGRPVPVIGDLKAEIAFSPPPLRWEGEAVVAGSTREGDEAAVLDAWRTLRPSPLLILAPRHLRRQRAVERLLEGAGVRWRRRSELGDRVPSHLEVVLLDVEGELRDLYPQARVAVIGGTWDPRIGGHSAAEPRAAGIPVVHGPHTGANASSFEGERTWLAPKREALAVALEGALHAPPPPVPPPAGSTERALRFLAPALERPVPPEVPHRPGLQPLVPLYVAARGLHRRAIRPQEVGIPVIAVGSLVSGGAGKTPLAWWLWRALEARGWRTAVLYRGYRRTRRGPEVRVAQGPGADATRLGDEAAWMAREGAWVVSAPDRYAAAREAERRGANAILLDDGLQQRRLAVDLPIWVVDAAEPLGGGRIPVGERREPLRTLARAALCVAVDGALPPTVAARLSATTRDVRARRVAVGWVVAGQGAKREPKVVPVASLPPQPVDVLAGIARPASFLRMIRTLGHMPVRVTVLRDHAPISRGAWRRIRGQGRRPLVTTEKDRVRLPGGGGPGVFALRVELRLEQGEEALVEALENLLGPRRPGGAP